MKNQFELLKSKRFFPLFLTQSLGAFNDNLFKNALVIMITYQLSSQMHYSPEILISVAAGLFILPFFLFSALAGQLADKFSKNKLICYTKLAEIAIMLIACVGLYFANINLLLATLFLLGCQATFFGPVKYAILPDLLKDNELIAGNGLIESGTFLAILLGTVAGGLFATSTSSAILVSSAIIFISIIGYIASLKIPHITPITPNLIINFNFWDETRKIIKSTFANNDIRLIVLAISWFWLIGAIYLAQFPSYAKNVLGAEPAVVTIFLMLFSAGIGLGSLLCNQLSKGRIDATYVPAAILGMSIFAMDLVFASRHATLLTSTELMTTLQFLSSLANYRILFDIFMIACCGGIYIVPLYALLQHNSDEHTRSRTIACNNIISALFMVIASIATSAMLYFDFSITRIFFCVAFANMLVAIYICKLLPGELIKSILIWLAKILYRVEVKGLDNYTKAGERVLIIANHTSFIDAALLAALLPEKISFAADAEFVKKWWMRPLLKFVNVYPMNPTNPLSTKSLIEYLRQDKHVTIFPEGRITVTGGLMKIYEGPGLIADKSKATIVPIRIDGAQYTPFSRLRNKVKTRWFPKITLTILEPLKIEIPDNIKGRERRKQLGLKLYDVMADMMFTSENINETLFQSLLNAKAIHGSTKPILQDIENKPSNYRQLITKSIALGRYIAQTSTASEHLGILLPNSVAGVTVFFAMQFSHRIPAMLNFSAGIQNVLSACHTANIKQIYTSKKFIERAKLTELEQALLTQGLKLVYLEDIKSNISLLQQLFAKLASFGASTYYHYYNGLNKHHYSALTQSPAVILFTSGSEGKPKGVVLSHRNILANRSQLSSSIDFTPTDRILNALPIFHSFGLSSATLLPILSGIYVFMYPSPLHYKIIPELSYNINATILFGTDTFLERYAKSSHPYNFYSIRYVFAGAEKLRDNTKELWSEKFGVRVMEGYGATETSPVISTNSAMHHKKNTVGRLLPGMEHRLEPIPGIDNGYRLYVKDPNVMLGYLLHDKPNAITPPPDGWYDTGDIVSLDDEGYITIRGRAKRFAKIAGEMVSLTAAEEAIHKIWPTHRHAILAVPDERKGEKLILCTENPTADLTTIIDYFKTNGIAEINLPKAIRVIAIMPILGSGKIDYPALQQILAGA